MAIKVKDLKKVQELLESRDVPLTYITLDGLSGISISADNAQGVRLTLV